MRNHLLLLAFVMFLAFKGTAQVQVSREPRHHNVFENEWVRILDVHIPPHDTTLMHKHSTPSVFMVLSNTRTGSQVLVEPGKTSFAAGNIWFESFKDTPRIHRVWNEDTVEFHVIDMELLHSPAPVPHYGGKIAFSAMRFDVAPVQAFRVSLPPGDSVILPALKEPFLVVGLSGTGAFNGQPSSRKGDYRFLPADGPRLILSNKGGSVEAQFAVFILY